MKIPDKTINEIKQYIYSQMCAWKPYDNGSDYCCDFCGRRSRSNIDLNIEHASDCDGIRFIAEINHAEKLEG